MPRDIPVGNGKLLVCFDSDYRIRDLYYPHVGQENHVNGNYCRFGVWVEGRFSWVGPGWQLDLKYVSSALVTNVSLYNEELKLLLLCKDAVDFHEDVFVREIVVENLAPLDGEKFVFSSPLTSASMGTTLETPPHTILRQVGLFTTKTLDIFF